MLPDPINVTAVDVYKQLKKSNFRNLNLPIVQEKKKEENQADLERRQSTLKMSDRKLSLKERVEIYSKMKTYVEGSSQ